MKQLLAIASALALAGCAVQARETGNAGPAGDVEPAPAAVSGAEDPGPPPGMPQPITLAQRPDATGGEALYVKHCIMCHGPNGMGTGLLARRMEVALLEQRENLPAAYVVQAARRGIGNMPPIPRGEVSDEEMQLVAKYLAEGPH